MNNHTNENKTKREFREHFRREYYHYLHSTYLLHRTNITTLQTLKFLYYENNRQKFYY